MKKFSVSNLKDEPVEIKVKSNDLSYHIIRPLLRGFIVSQYFVWLGLSTNKGADVKIFNGHRDLIIMINQNINTTRKS